MKGLKVLVLLVSLALGALAQPSIWTSLGYINGTTCASVTTPNGVYTGGYQYLAIPYAVAPVGNLRWTNAVPYTTPYPGGTLVTTTSFSSICSQLSGTQYVGSEDCLYLNVWIPPTATPTSNLPVKVWIYGGSNTAGDTASLEYNGCWTTVQSNAIIVSMNYRLSIFGFFATQELIVEGEGRVGNFGLLDQRQALTWVQENIAAFGGNPNQVLLFGQSAGAKDTLHQFLMPGSLGLFNAIFVESESLGNVHLTTAEFALQYGEQAKANLNCTEALVGNFSSVLECLRSLPASVVINAIPLVSNALLLPVWGPLVDGIELPEQPISLLQQGKFPHDIPVGIGAVSAEGNLFALAEFDNVEATTAELDEYLAYYANDNATILSALSTQYRGSTTTTGLSYTTFEAIGQVWTDYNIHCPMRRAITYLSQGTNVYFYEYEHTPSADIYVGSLSTTIVNLLGPTHTAEIPFVFFQPILNPSKPTSSYPTALEYNISVSLNEAWTSIAVNGNPGFNWPTWDPVNKRTAIWTSGTPTFSSVDWSAKCAIWDTITGFTAEAAQSTPTPLPTYNNVPIYSGASLTNTEIINAQPLTSFKKNCITFNQNNVPNVGAVILDNQGQDYCCASRAALLEDPQNADSVACVSGCFSNVVTRVGLLYDGAYCYYNCLVGN